MAMWTPMRSAPSAMPLNDGMKARAALAPMRTAMPAIITMFLDWTLSLAFSPIGVASTACVSIMMEVRMGRDALSMTVFARSVTNEASNRAK